MYFRRFNTQKKQGTIKELIALIRVAKFRRLRFFFLNLVLCLIRGLVLYNNTREVLCLKQEVSNIIRKKKESYNYKIFS